MITALLPAMAVGMNPTLTIVGEGTATVSADTATISVSVESDNENMTAARADAQEKMQQAINALKAEGVKDEDILPGQSSGVTSFQSTSRVCKRVNNSTICENNTDQATSFKRSTLIRLDSTDEATINRVLDAARSAGAQAYVAGYGLKDPSKATAQARMIAVADAKKNAAGMAAAEGARLGKVLDISDYGYPNALNDYYSSSTHPGTIAVTAYVIVTYELVV
jgi:uncharacterized protein